MPDNVALFVREYKKDGFGLTAPFCLLGLVDYRSHEGERPVSIIWSLRKPIPVRVAPRVPKSGLRYHRPSPFPPTPIGVPDA
ncbi:MAG: hypothetical protein IKF78_03885 [Atopobiaceae bacterium]|nr:hypothetical protein [Atopobiaceae bacterium]